MTTSAASRSVTAVAVSNRDGKEKIFIAKFYRPGDFANSALTFLTRFTSVSVTWKCPNFFKQEQNIKLLLTVIIRKNVYIDKLVTFVAFVQPKAFNAICMKCKVKSTSELSCLCDCSDVKP